MVGEIKGGSCIAVADRLAEILDSTPTHSYMKFLYKYSQRQFLYEDLIGENQRRSRDVPEFEIWDSDAFDDDRYWDVFVEVATVSTHLLNI